MMQVRCRSQWGKKKAPLWMNRPGQMANEKAAKAKSKLDQGLPQEHRPKQKKPQMNGGDRRDKGEVVKERSMQDRGLKLAYLCQRKYRCKAIQRRLIHEIRQLSDWNHQGKQVWKWVLRCCKQEGRVEGHRHQVCGSNES